MPADTPAYAASKGGVLALTTDVAWAVLFLASSASRWTTGTVIPVDAGMLISAPMSVGQWQHPA